VTFGSEVVTDDLGIEADIRIDTFPAKGAKVPEILGGISGEVSMTGRLSEHVAVRQMITPGISTFGAGKIDVHLELEDGVVRAGSRYSLESDAFQLRIMDLDATGSATVSGSTVREGRDHVTSSHVVFGDFEFVDAEDGSVDISGTGVELDATWNGLSLAGTVPASHVELVLPRAQIHDVSAFDGLIPEQTALSIVSGTGEVEAKLAVQDRVAAGTLDLVAEEIVLKSQETPLIGDLEVHANLAEGDLPTRQFDFSGTTVRLDNMVDKTLSERKQEKLVAWYCAAALEKGDVTFGKPLTVDGSVTIEMHDTRPVMAALKRLGVGPKWLSIAPNVQNVGGTRDVDVRKGFLAFDDLVMTGDGFEALGWLHVANKTTDGRLFARFKAIKAGISIDQGKADIHLSKPRLWFEEQPKGPESYRTNTDESSGEVRSGQPTPTLRPGNWRTGPMRCVLLAQNLTRTNRLKSPMSKSRWPLSSLPPSGRCRPSQSTSILDPVNPPPKLHLSPSRYSTEAFTIHCPPLTSPTST